jgi:hypothetical protein
VPQRACVLVQFSGYWYAQADTGCPCTFQANFRPEDDNGACVALQQLTDANAANGTIRDTAAGSYLFVAPAGMRYCELAGSPLPLGGTPSAYLSPAPQSSYPPSVLRIVIERIGTMAACRPAQ